MRPGPLLALLLLVVGGCRWRETRYPVEKVTLTGAALADGGELGLEAASIQALFTDKLKEGHRFELLEDGEARRVPGAWRLTLELPFTREVLKDGGQRTSAEVGAVLRVEQRGEDGRQYEMVGLGEVRVEGEGADARRTALREALKRALAQVTELAALQVAASARGDDALEKDLKSADARVRECAQRVLVERLHPAAIPLLVAQLRGRDPIRVRQAMGALVELKAQSAVPALIELTKGQDAGFVREVVFALGEIGGLEVEGYLFTVAQGHDHPAVQAAAQRALDTLEASRKLASPEARGTERAEH